MELVGAHTQECLLIPRLFIEVMLCVKRNNVLLPRSLGVLLQTLRDFARSHVHAARLKIRFQLRLNLMHFFVRNP